MTRIGLAGCGRWGKLILRDLLALRVEVAVAAPSDGTRADALARGAASAHLCVDDLPEADGYVVAVPTSLHAWAVERLLPRGRPLFVEKPLTCNAEDASRILAAAPDRVFCMDKWRYHGGVLKLAELTRGGELGDVLAVNSWRLGWGNPHPDVDAAWILAPHDLSIALEILGHLPPVRQAHGLRAGELGESLWALLRGADGGPSVTFEVSASHPVNRRSVLVIGTAGAAQFGDSYDEVVHLSRPGKGPQDLPVRTEMPLLAELRAFVEHLQGGPPPKSSVQDAALIVSRIAELRELAGFDDG